MKQVHEDEINNPHSRAEFEEKDGQLLATFGRETFLVGPVERQGWDAEVRRDGRIIARTVRNTGWSFIPQTCTECPEYHDECNGTPGYSCFEADGPQPHEPADCPLA